MPDSKKLKVFYADFGCRLNQFETRVLKNSPAAGLVTTKNQHEADYIVINTCTVTNRADVKNRQAIRRARLANPHAHIIVTGCQATSDPETLTEMPEVNTVVANSQKFTIPDFILGNTIDHTVRPFPVSNQNLQQSARAYLKIQDGCNKRCSYCKIPVSRGRAVSREMNDTLAEVRTLAGAGFHEIILTGINIGHYRDGKNRLPDLLKRLQDVEGDHYYRISSIEPDSVDSEFLDLLASEKFARFLHVPVQSGSNAVLKVMRRGYEAERYAAIIEEAKARIPGIHIGTDIIVGFPGESEADFEKSRALVEKLEFANVHIFPFSKRSGSEIDRVLSQKTKDIPSGESSTVFTEIPGDTVKKRVKVLTDLQETNKVKYLEKISGTVVRAIVEKSTGDMARIVTENYLKGELPLPGAPQKGQLVRVTCNFPLGFTAALA